MATASLFIDLDAIAANWQALDRLSATGVQTAAVVKADAYGLGIDRVAGALAQAGAAARAAGRYAPRASMSQASRESCM